MKKEDIQKKLLSLQDEKYRDFTAKLMPTVDKKKIIGVRSPLLRAFAKELIKENDYGDFLSSLPHKYYEEDNLHGFIIEGIKDIDLCISELRRFVPFTDNWATCDCVRPKCLKKEPEKVYSFILELFESKEVYSVRYGIGLLLSFYLDGNFSPMHLEILSEIKSDEYYINMMLAWYFATALAKQWESTVPYIEKRILPDWVHRKAIQKAVESYRITPEQKAYLKSLK